MHSSAHAHAVSPCLFQLDLTTQPAASLTHPTSSQRSSSCVTTSPAPAAPCQPSCRYQGYPVAITLPGCSAGTAILARACSCAGTCWGCSCRDCQQIFCGDSQGYSCSVKKQMGMGENHCQPWHKLGTQGRTSCNTPNLGAWSEQRPHVSHPCSTGSSQRKGAKSVPIQVTPGCKDTCRT